MFDRQAHNPRHLLSVNDTRLFLGGIGRTKLYELVAKGELKALKLGRRTLFVEADLIAYAEGLPRAHAGR